MGDQLKAWVRGEARKAPQGQHDVKRQEETFVESRQFSPGGQTRRPGGVSTLEVHPMIRLLTIRLHHGPLTLSPYASTMAIMVATSTAAEEETPLPSGTSEETMMARLCPPMDSACRPSSLARTIRQPTMYPAQLVAALA